MYINKLILITGESGIGKTTLQNNLATKFKFERVVLTTTRPPRENEIDKFHFYFTDRNKFNFDKFIFFNEMFGNFYGLSYDEIKRVSSTQKIAVLVSHIKDKSIIKYFAEEVIIINIKVNDKFYFYRNRNNQTIKRIKERENCSISSQKSEFNNLNFPTIELFIDTLDECSVLLEVAKKLKMIGYIRSE